MLTVTITLKDSDAQGSARQSVAIVRISEPADGSDAYGVFALERAEPRMRWPARMAACTVPAAGGETVLALLGRACRALAAAEWAEL